MLVSLQMDNYTDRERIILGLANQGYKTWVEVRNIGITAGDAYFVCFNLKSKEEYSE